MQSHDTDTVHDGRAGAGALAGYSARVRRLPVLTAEEEAALVRRWMDRRDPAAARRLIEGHLRLVLILSARFRGNGVSRDELVAEGNLGLLRALERFDGRKVRFATYATYWIRSAMLAAVMKGHSLVPWGSSARQARLFFRLRGERARLEARHGQDRERVDGELARLFNASPEEIEAHTARLSGPDFSLDAPVSDDDESTAVGHLAAEERGLDEALVERERDRVLRQLLARERRALDARERLILDERLLSDEEQTLQALGERVGLTRERMRQLEAKLKARLRRVVATERLAS